MANFTAGAVLTASALNTAFNTATINAQTTGYTIGTADAGELVTVNNNSGGTVTIPANSTWGAATGTIVSVLNAGTAGSWTIGTAAGVTLNANSASLAPLESGQLVKTATNTWYFTKGGPGKASVTATTGSPTVTTVGTQTCYKFTGSGSITIGNGGLCDVLVVGGGGGGGGVNATGGSGGGGGGQVLSLTSYYVAAGAALTVTIGGGGAGGTGNATGSKGNTTQLSSLNAFGGGGGQGGTGSAAMGQGASTGGAGYQGSQLTAVFTEIGGTGGNSASNAGGGGGGAAPANGTNASGNTAGNGGNGSANSITGTSITYGSGGGGGGVTGGTGGTNSGGNGESNGGANGSAGSNGGGGGGRYNAGSANGYNGGSGVVIILIG